MFQVITRLGSWISLSCIGRNNKVCSAGEPSLSMGWEQNLNKVMTGTFLQNRIGTSLCVDVRVFVKITSAITIHDRKRYRQAACVRLHVKGAREHLAWSCALVTFHQLVICSCVWWPWPRRKLQPWERPLLLPRLQWLRQWSFSFYLQWSCAPAFAVSP